MVSNSIISKSSIVDTASSEICPEVVFVQLTPTLSNNNPSILVDLIVSDTFSPTSTLRTITYTSSVFQLSPSPSAKVPDTVVSVTAVIVATPGVDPSLSVIL